VKLPSGAKLPSQAKLPGREKLSIGAKLPSRVKGQYCMCVCTAHACIFDERFLFKTGAPFPVLERTRECGECERDQESRPETRRQRETIVAVCSRWQHCIAAFQRVAACFDVL